MNPVTEDVKNLLVTAGYTFAGTSDWGVFISMEPNKPDNCITLFDTGGPTPLGCMDRSKHKLLCPTFQVRVRGKNYKTTHDKVEAINAILDQHAAWTVGTVRYQSMQMAEEPSSLGEDENDRYIWVTNYTTYRKET